MHYSEANLALDLAAAYAEREAERYAFIRAI